MIAIICDKFKGTLTSRQAGEAIVRGLRSRGIAEEIVVLEGADGGEGTASALAELSGTAVIESARRRDATPFADRNTAYVGRAIRAALERGDRVIVGIGGTSSADCGMGMLQALGYRFYSRGHSEITEAVTPRLLACCDLEAIEPPADSAFVASQITALSDVRASLRGPGLSLFDFLAQKGALEPDAAMVRLMIDKILALLHDINGAARSEGPHAGAGGGLGFAFETILGARCVQGAGFVVHQQMSGLHPRLIITGEGCMDKQTAGGKLVHEVYAYGASEGIPVASICGKITPGMAGHYPHTFACCGYRATPPSSATEAAARLEEVAAKAALPL